MRAVSWTTCLWPGCLWPGLAGLWLRGRWGSLVLAIAFGLALQFALLHTFAAAVMPVVLAGASPLVVWGCVLGFWIVGMWLGWLEFAPRQAPQDPQLDEWFCEAQTEYLKGHWFEAEALLARLLARHPGDIEARLLLASVQRRSGRLAEARQTLDELKKGDSAARWGWEIHTDERRIIEIERATAEADSEEPLNDQEPPPPLARAA